MVSLIVSNLVRDWIWIGGKTCPAQHYCTSLLSSRCQFGRMCFGRRVSERDALWPTRVQSFPPTVLPRIIPILSLCSRMGCWSLDRLILSEVKKPILIFNVANNVEQLIVYCSQAYFALRFVTQNCHCSEQRRADSRHIEDVITRGKLWDQLIIACSFA